MSPHPIVSALRREAREAPESGIVEVMNYGRGRPDLIPLWAGEGDLPTPDFICAAAASSLQAGETFYTWQRGIPELREALARYHERPFGRAFPDEHFYVTGSGMQAIDPALRYHHKAVPVTAAHNRQLPRAGAGDDGLHLAALIARIRDDALQKRKAAACLPQQGLGPVPVLHTRGMHADAQQQAERVGQDVALAARRLLGRVIARRVERGPPLGAPLAVWLSRMAVVGLASRPALSRTSR